MRPPLRLSCLPLPDWPFDLEATLNSGQVFHWHEWDRGFAGMIGEVPVYLEQAGPRELRCTAAREELARHYLGLDHDLTAITSSFPLEDSTLKRAVSWCPGLRLLRQPHWECLATFITSSLKQVSHIRRISLTLREQFGRPVSAMGLPLQHSYPSAGAIAAAGEGALRECGLGYRAAFLHKAAVEVASRRLSLDAITALPDAEALSALCGLHGVGEKIASCTLLFAWERHGMFPIDVWIERVLRELYFPRRRKISARQIRDFAQEHFGTHCGYAQQFLFHWARMTGCGAKV